MIDPQLLIVGLCVLAAAAWLTWRIVRAWRGTASTGCGTACADCPQSQGASAGDGFVSVDQLLRSPPRKD